jgi:hypothetical protein
MPILNSKKLVKLNFFTLVSTLQFIHFLEYYYLKIKKKFAQWLRNSNLASLMQNTCFFYSRHLTAPMATHECNIILQILQIVQGILPNCIPHPSNHTYYVYTLPNTVHIAADTLHLWPNWPTSGGLTKYHLLLQKPQQNHLLSATLLFSIKTHSSIPRFSPSRTK